MHIEKKICCGAAFLFDGGEIRRMLTKPSESQTGLSPHVSALNTRLFVRREGCEPGVYTEDVP